MRFPNENLSVVTLSNSGKMDTVTQSLLMTDVILNLKSDKAAFVTKPPRIGKLVSSKELLGTYLTDNDFTFKFLETDGKLYLRRIGRGDVLLEREADNVFHQTYDPDFKQEFTKSKRGEMQVTAYYTSHAPYTLTRPNNDWEKFDFQSLNGKFVNNETDVMFTITHAEGQSYDISDGKRKRTGLLVTPSKLILVGNYVIEWSGKPGLGDALLLSGGRIQNVKFVRTE